MFAYRNKSVDLREKLLIGTNFSALDSPLSLKLPLLRAYSTTPSERKLSAKEQKSSKNDLFSFVKYRNMGPAHLFLSS